MTKRQSAVRTTAINLTAIVVTLFAAGGRPLAEGWSGNDPQQARAIEGVWLPTVTITDCQTQAVMASFPSMETYLRGGGFVGFGAVRQADQIGMGAWRHLGGRKFAAEYQFFNYMPFGAPDGTPDGTLLKVSATIRLSADGTAFTSSDTAVVVDYSGNVLAQVCGHREAKRLQ